MPKVWKIKRAMETAYKLADRFTCKGNIPLGNHFLSKHNKLRITLSYIHDGWIET